VRGLLQYAADPKSGMDFWLNSTYALCNSPKPVSERGGAENSMQKTA